MNKEWIKEIFYFDWVFAANHHLLTGQDTTIKIGPEALVASIDLSNIRQRRWLPSPQTTDNFIQRAWSISRHCICKYSNLTWLHSKQSESFVVQWFSELLQPMRMNCHLGWKITRYWCESTYEWGEGGSVKIKAHVNNIGHVKKDDQNNPISRSIDQLLDTYHYYHCLNIIRSCSLFFFFLKKWSHTRYLLLLVNVDKLVGTTTKSHLLSIRICICANMKSGNQWINLDYKNN